MLVDQVEGAFGQIEAGLVEEGLASLKKLLKHPDLDDEIKFEVAQMYYQYGFVTEAIDVLEELLSHYTGEAEIILTLAEIYMENNDNERALDLLESISIEQGDDYLRAILLISELYIMDGLFEVAESKIRKALELFPDEDVLYTALGEVFYVQEKYSLAALNYEKGSIISTYAKLADCYAHLGQFEISLDYYKKAATTDKENPELLFGYGFVAYQLGELDLAISKFKALLDLDPFYTSAYPILSEALGQNGVLEEAIHYLDEGIKYDETNPYLFYLKGQLLRKQGEQHLASHWLQKALELDDSSTPVLDELLDLNIEAEDWDEALAYIDRLADVVPERADLYVKQGHALEQLERWKDAEKAFRHALELDPESTSALNQLAFLLRDEGRLDEAISLWKKSFSLDPEQTDIGQLIEEV